MENMQTFIQSPADQSRIYTIFDPPHMLKLVRNVLAKEQSFLDDENKLVQWKFFVLLDEFRCKKDFNYCHKLTKAHINFEKNKMNVRLATETLSNSVADALEHLMTTGATEFAEAGPTIRFVRMFNDLFDTMNSRHKSMFDNNIFKRPLYAENKRIIFDLFDRSCKYIDSLKVRHPTSRRWIKVTSSDWKTGFKGFVINTKSIQSIYMDYVENEKLLDWLPVFDMNQDRLECYFGKVRALNRQNDNPTAQQFSAAYRKLLCISDIKLSNVSNCQDVFYRSVASNILKVSSRKNEAIDQTNDLNEGLDDDRLNEESEKLHSYVNQIEENGHIFESLNKSSIVYVASKIEERLNGTEFYCEQCKNIFSKNGKVEDKLLVSKKMQRPCKSTFEICKLCDLILMSKKTEMFQDGLDFKIIYHLILREIGEMNLFANTDFSNHADHKYYVIRCVIDSFIRIKLTNFAQSTTLKIKGEQVRHYLHKIIHSSGQ